MLTDNDGHSIQLSKGNTKKVMRRVSDRVSDDAAILMAYQMEQEILRKTQAAQLAAQHAGRETIKEQDVRAANNIIDVFYDMPDR